MRRNRILVLLFIVPVIGACRPYGTPGGQSAPVYEVTQQRLGDEKLRALMDDLGIPASARTEHGAIRYMAPDFAAVPLKELGTADQRDEDGAQAVLQAFDLPALREIKAPDAARAASRFDAALRKAALPPFAQGPIKAVQSIGHSRFAAVGRGGESLTDPAGAILDTHVSFSLSLNGAPLIGPGAEMKAVFDRDLKPTLVRVALRDVARGPSVPILSANAAASACRDAFGAKNAEVRAQLVYYAPPPEITTVRTIVPHYQCEGTLLIGDRRVPLRRVLVPAIADAPKVTISADPKTSEVVASANVSGGTPPYTYIWNTPGGSGPRQTGREASFSMLAPQGDARKGQTISVVVVDANGLKAQASTTLAAPVRAAAPVTARESGAFVVGAEWIGTCQGLGGSAANAGGFVSNYSASGATIRFNWGNGNAWQRDYLDLNITPSALDQDMVDNADFTFYTGHADGDGFTFCSEQNTGFLGFTDQPKWGDKDSEWLIVAACGPLQLDSSGQRWWQRWGPAFDGLHLFMGYQTVTADNEIEGTIVATRTLAGRTVRQAWIEAAHESQGESEIWAVMGVIGPSGSTNWNDHVWGSGTVGPDIRGGNIQGFWITWGPS